LTKGKITKRYPNEKINRHTIHNIEREKTGKRTEKDKNFIGKNDKDSITRYGKYQARVYKS
jgi:hypothetical protein